MRLFQTKAFVRFAKKALISDAVLCDVVRDTARGLVAADLGGVIKQRVARPGQGKAGGFRVLLIFRIGARAIFVHGFAKNEKHNIEPDELFALKKLAAELLAYDDTDIAKALASGALVEVACDEKAIS